MPLVDVKEKPINDPYSEIRVIKDQSDELQTGGFLFFFSADKKKAVRESTLSEFKRIRLMRNQLKNLLFFSEQLISSNL